MKGFYFISLLMFGSFSIDAQPPIRSANYRYQAPQPLEDGITTGSMSSIGIDSNKINALAKLILVDSFPNIHSLLIMKDNVLVYENYFAGKDQISGKNLGFISHGRDDLHDCRSITKSVVSACVGIAIQQGLIKGIDDPIFDYLGEYKNFMNDKNSKITIRHLLTMSSGLKWNEQISYTSFKNSEVRMDLSLNPIRYILKRPVISDPGTQWNYSGGDTQLLAEIIKKVSGQTIEQFAERNLFKPLGIKNYRWIPLIRRHSIPAAAAGLRLTSRSMLKLGMLYMNDGKWMGAEILSDEWVRASLHAQVPHNKIKKTGYGYQFWTYSVSIGNKNYHLAEAKGNGGNAIFICKALNLLVVITAGNYNQWNIVNNSHEALVKYIIPAIQ